MVAAVFVTAFVLSVSDMGDMQAQLQDSALFSFSVFSRSFMQDYWFHFELATVLLLAGILAAWTALKEGRDG
jgi:NADH:ubiquinone oxidoreductase subunit 6 (subunit J)